MPHPTNDTPDPCTCPRIDHREGTYIVSSDCPVHGKPTPEREPPEGLTEGERELYEAAVSAAASEPGQWVEYAHTVSSLNPRGQNVAVPVEGGWVMVAKDMTPAVMYYMVAANPAAVLALLSEVARLRANQPDPRIVRGDEFGADEVQPWQIEWTVRCPDCGDEMRVTKTHPVKCRCGTDWDVYVNGIVYRAALARPAEGEGKP